MDLHLRREIQVIMDHHLKEPKDLKEVPLKDLKVMSDRHLKEIRV